MASSDQSSPGKETQTRTLYLSLVYQLTLCSLSVGWHNDRLLRKENLAFFKHRGDIHTVLRAMVWAASSWADIVLLHLQSVANYFIPYCAKWQVSSCHSHYRGLLSGVCTVAQLYSHNGIKHFAERLSLPAGVVFVCTLLSDLIQNYEITAFFTQGFKKQHCWSTRSFVSRLIHLCSSVCT